MFSVVLCLKSVTNLDCDSMDIRTGNITVRHPKRLFLDLHRLSCWDRIGNKNAATVPSGFSVANSHTEESRTHPYSTHTLQR